MSRAETSSRYLASKSYHSRPSPSRISAGTLTSGGAPSSPSSTASSISRPGTAASTSTLSSAARAAAIAAGSAAQSSTRLIPIDEPPRAGLTNTGSPSRSWSASASDAPARTTAYGPTGRPSAASSFLVNSLSIATALPSTPEPTYGTPAISSSPWIVPSSPNGPCSTGKTTSTPCSTLAPSPGSTTTRPPAVGSPGSITAVPVSTVGSSRPAIAQRLRVARGEHPGALGRDPDRHHLVPGRVERREDAPRGHAGDRVLRAPAAEDDGDAHSPSGHGHARHPTRGPAPHRSGTERGQRNSGMTCAPNRAISSACGLNCSSMSPAPACS